MLITKECEICGKEFTRKKRSDRTIVCCSPQCANTLGARRREKQVEVTCANCGAKFQKKRSQCLKTTKHFCDMTCMGQWQSEHWTGKDNPAGCSRISCTCLSCGREFERKAASVRNGEGKFCSHVCKGVWLSKNASGEKSVHWRGGKSRTRGDNWHSQREEARKRDNYRCQNCGVHEDELSRKLDVHHIVAYHSFTDYKEANQLTNLICLCHSCHKKAEYGRILLRPKLL